MSDLVQRMREHGELGKRPISKTDVHRAADRIEQLEQRESELVQQGSELNDEINRMRNEHARQVEQLESHNAELREALKRARKALDILQMMKREIPKTMGEVNLRLIMEDITEAEASLSAALSAADGNKGKENG